MNNKVIKIKIRILKHGKKTESVFSKCLSMAKRGLVKIAAVSLIIGLNWFSFFIIGQTWAFFSDTEISESNSFTVGTLDFSLDSPNDFPVLACGAAVRDIKIIKGGTLNFKYTAQIGDLTGDFCDNLDLQLLVDGVEKYSGSLKDFALSQIIELSENQDNWGLAVTPSLKGSKNEICHFNLKFKAWQTDLEEPTGGFSDEEEISSVIETASCIPNIVINEVYYDVDDEHGLEWLPHSDEWVELYNNGDSDVNLKNWSLTDNYSEATISHRNVILPAHEFAVLAKAAQTWTYWNIPDEAIKIELGQNIGDSLTNDSDRVILKDNEGNVVDMMSYGDDNFAFDPPCTDVDEGHSLARNPKGFDTDQASDWIDLASPNPGTNPHFLNLTEEPGLIFNEKAESDIIINNLTDNNNNENETTETDESTESDEINENDNSVEEPEENNPEESNLDEFDANSTSTEDGLDEEPTETEENNSTTTETGLDSANEPEQTEPDKLTEDLNSNDEADVNSEETNEETTQDQPNEETIDETNVGEENSESSDPGAETNEASENQDNSSSPPQLDSANDTTVILPSDDLDLPAAVPDNSGDGDTGE